MPARVGVRISGYSSELGFKRFEVEVVGLPGGTTLGLRLPSRSCHQAC